MFFVMILGVVLNYLFPKGLFFVIAAMATFATVWVWLTVLISQVAMRKKLSKEETRQLKFPVPFWPIGPAFAIGFMIFVIGILGYYEPARKALYAGGIWLAFLLDITFSSITPSAGVRAFSICFCRGSF